MARSFTSTRESAWVFYALIRANSNLKFSTRGSLTLLGQKRGRNVASAIICTGPIQIIRFYKRGCQDQYFPSDEKHRVFAVHKAHSELAVPPAPLYFRKVSLSVFALASSTRSLR